MRRNNKVMQFTYIHLWHRIWTLCLVDGFALWYPKVYPKY